VERLSVWLGAGVITAGMSAAMLVGAAVAGADTDSGPGSAGATSSGSAEHDTRQAPNSTGTKRDPSGTGPNRGVKLGTGRADDKDDGRSDGRPASSSRSRPDDEADADADTRTSEGAAAAVEAKHVGKESRPTNPSHPCLVPTRMGQSAWRSNDSNPLSG
jgi:hypothetical protein